MSLAFAVVVLVAVAVAPATSGNASPTTRSALEPSSQAGTAVDRALIGAMDTGLLPRAAGRRYRAIVAAALAAERRLPSDRADLIAAVLRGIERQGPRYGAPRALTLFAMLEANVRYFEHHAVPRAPTDITRDGVVYRFFASEGFQFHPLANFARLNALTAGRRAPDAARLAAALVARGVPDERALTWEYYFAFHGPSRWTSGMAQAVGAQALIRASVLLQRTDFARAARRAYRAIPDGLSRPLGGGLWIREYGFSNIAILNAQLQSLLSIRDYARLAGDSAARAIAGRLETATLALLPRFDTGCWAYYSLGGALASIAYQRYHVQLVKKLAANHGDPRWSEVAARWESALAAGCR